MKNINLTINKKYKNYYLYIKKYLSKENINELLKIDDFESNMVEKDILLLAEKVNNYKINLIFNKNNNGNEITKDEIFNCLNKMNNFNITHFFNNNNFLVYKNTTTINKYFGDLILDIKSVLDKYNDINADTLLSRFYFYDILKVLSINPNQSFKLKSFNSDYEKPIDTIKNMIYGRGFENLNKTFLNNLKNLKLKKAPSLEEWNNIIIEKLYLKEIEENPNKNITYNEWKKNNVTNSIPSVDLIGEKFKKTIYIENKNFSIFNNELNIKFNYGTHKVIDRFKKLSMLEEIDNGGKVFFNINTYNLENNNLNNFLIPLEDYKKDLFSKINKSLISKLKTEVKNKRLYNYSIPLEISKNGSNGKIDVKLIIEVQFNHLPDIRNIDNEHYNFNVKFLNSNDFNLLFEDFNLERDFQIKKEASNVKLPLRERRGFLTE